MWNLRWNVGGFLQVVPDVDEPTLAGRFIAGSGISRSNLRRACIKQSWEHQQEKFAEILLTSLFALYESWCEQTLVLLHCTASNAVKRVQFPTKCDTHGRAIEGVGEVLTRLAGNESRVMIPLIYPELVRHPKYSFTHLEKYLVCYRYFKEMRNCLMHNGGIADQKCVDRYNDFANIPTGAAIGLKELPQHGDFG
jgi:hypothetical protein